MRSETHSVYFILKNHLMRDILIIHLFIYSFFFSETHTLAKHILPLFPRKSEIVPGKQMMFLEGKYNKSYKVLSLKNLEEKNYCLSSMRTNFLKYLFNYWKDRITDRRKTEISLPTSASHPGWLQQPTLGQTKSGASYGLPL